MPPGSSRLGVVVDFTIASGTALTFSGQLLLAGSRTLTNGISNLAVSGSIGEVAPGGELTLAGSGTLALSGTGLTLGTSLKLNAGTLTATGLITTAGHTFTQNAGTFTGSLINRGSFVYNGGTHSGNISNEAGGIATFNSNLTLTAALTATSPRGIPLYLERLPNQWASSTRR